jgi:hypothetical protein
VLGPVPDRLLSVGLLFVFKGLLSPRKSTRTQRPARAMLMAGKGAACQERMPEPVMPGLLPGIHVLVNSHGERRG